MRTIIFKLAGKNAKGDWFMVKLSGYYDDKKDTYHMPTVVFDESLYNTKEVGDIIRVV